MGAVVAVILILVLSFIVILALFSVMSFIRLYNRTKNIQAEVDRQLKYRYGLVFKLIKMVSDGYHQKSGDAEKLSHAYEMWSGASSIGDKTRAEKKLNEVLKLLVDGLKSKPGPEANDDLAVLFDELDWNEMKLVYAQMFYNDQVRKYLKKRRFFLWSLAACIFRFRNPEIFDVDNYSRKVQMDLTF